MHNLSISIAFILLVNLISCQSNIHQTNFLNSNKKPPDLKRNSELRLHSDSTLRKTIRKELDQVFNNDQDLRQSVQATSEKFGWKSSEMRALTDSIMFRDSVNLIKVKKILDEYGWLGTDILSENGNSALFLVLQHSNAETREHYLPILRNAVKRKIADPKDLAMMEDRVALERGKKQIFGTQVGYDKTKGNYYLFPLIDSVNVDQRRSKIGLGSLKDYLKKYGIN